MEHYFKHRISVHALEVLLYNYCYMKKHFSEETLLKKRMYLRKCYRYLRQNWNANLLMLVHEESAIKHFVGDENNVPF